MSDRRVATVTSEPATNPLARLLHPQQDVDCGGAMERLDLFHAGGHEAEVEAVVRRLTGAKG